MLPGRCVAALLAVSAALAQPRTATVVASAVASPPTEYFVSALAPGGGDGTASSPFSAYSDNE